MFRIIKEIKMGKSLYEYDLHTIEGLPYALYFSDISAYNGEKVPLHWHREFEITLVTKGRVKAFVDDVEMILEKGEGLFVNSEMFHGYTKIENEESEFLTAVFDSSFITGSESENFLFKKYVEPVIKSENLRFVKFSQNTGWHSVFLDNMKRLFEIKVPETEYSEFFVREMLAREICLLHDNNDLQKAPDLRGFNYTVSKMTDYIKANYTEDISVGDIAKSANISRRECFRKFSESMGITPFDYLDSVRIKAATVLLTESDKTITEICYETGFSSGSYFSTKFKKAIGCSPAEYRKISIKN